MTESSDNSLNSEHFDIIEFERKISFEITKNKEISNENFCGIQKDFFLRKRFPLMLNL